MGLDLGAGLDTRSVRLDPPSTVDWYDVDFPAVAAAREELIPARPNAHVIGADVRDTDWLDAIPADRPAVITGDGLMGFLSMDELVSLLNRLVNHFQRRDGLQRLHQVRHLRGEALPGTKSVADLVKFPGFDDPRELERWNLKLHLVREILIAREPEVAEFPTGLRLYYRLAARSTAWSRRGPSSCTTASSSMPGVGRRQRRLSRGGRSSRRGAPGARPTG